MTGEHPHRPHRPTLADVAARAGVSVTLVSIVLRDLAGASPRNRERVRRAAEDLGYRPDTHARLLRSTHSRLIGVVFTAASDFHTDLLGGLYAAADRRGYELTLSAMAPGRTERQAVGSLLRDRCEALILLGPTSATSQLAELATRLPVVTVARTVRAATVDVVRTDDELGARLAVDHLVELGHRHIAHIDGGRAPGAAERRRGYRRALAAHGLSDQEWIVPGGLDDEDGVRAAGQLVAARRLPTAVTVFNDRCAIGVLDVLRRSGRSVPEDISVVGYDDSRLARLSTLALTTVAQDTGRLTALAVDRAVDRLSGDRVAVGASPTDRAVAEDLRRHALVLPPHLVLRGTTGMPRRARRGRR